MRLGEKEFERYHDVRKLTLAPILVRLAWIVLYRFAHVRRAHDSTLKVTHAPRAYTLTTRYHIG